MPINYKKYPSNWKNEIVPRIIERSKNKCEICGLDNKQKIYTIRLRVQDNDGRYKQRTIWFRNKQDAEREQRYNDVAEKTVVLTIAHLDHDETNWEVKDERLKAMCQLCHLRYDAKEKYRRANAKHV